MNVCEPTEIQIPVPWGHIAGKVWGDVKDRKLLAVHGKQDNCAVFDRLIPMLKTDYFVVAIDLPGHGYSSHFPAGLPIYFLNYVLAIAYCIRYLHWSNFLFLGHSLGGQIGLFFSALFPESVQRLVVIDSVTQAYPSDDGVMASLSNFLTDFMKMADRLANGTSPTYTYTQALEKLTNRDSTLTTEAANLVLNRSLVKQGERYMFCMDQRLKLYNYPALTEGVAKSIVSHVRCPTLFLFSTKRYKQYQQLFEGVFPLIRSMTNMKVMVVKGNHDVHQNHPERVVGLIDEHFTTIRSML